MAVPLSPAGGMPEPPSQARVHFPVEGSTSWPVILRLIAFGSIVSVGTLAVIILILDRPVETGFHPEIVLAALVALLLFEVILVRRLIIPLNGDYGRYRITASRVDFYPLSTLGLVVLPQPESVALAEFRGLAIRVTDSTAAKFAVMLLHPRRARTVRVRTFALKAEAENYAHALAEALSLPLIEE